MSKIKPVIKFPHILIQIQLTIQEGYLHVPVEKAVLGGPQVL